MKAFLSHSSADNALAKQIYRWLRDQAVSVWFDRVELRPGDSLLSKIAGGITDVDCLVVLVTENSKNSKWVERELSIALTQEIEGTGPRVIPLLLRGCTQPTILADKVYIPVDQTGSGIAELIPAIFRDSYILDIALRPDDLGVDLPALKEELHDYYRSRLESVRVRLDNRSFNYKVLDIAEKATTAPDVPPAVREQIKRISDPLPIALPIFWTNLTDLLGRLIEEVFARYGKNLDALQIAAVSAEKALWYANYRMSYRIDGAIFPHHAEQFGYPELARYLQRYQSYKEYQGYDDEERVAREVCGAREGNPMPYVGLEGSVSRRVRDAKIFLPKLYTDSLILQMTCPVEYLIPAYAWYVFCLPQILGDFLSWTAFREGRPLHELDYTVGIRMDDYERIGYA